jgi:Flp pilus assembly protein TadB
MAKLLPFIAILLFTVICALAVFLVDPVLSFLRYWAAFGVIVGILLIKYLWEADEI